MITPNEFYTNVLGKRIEMDGVPIKDPVQCVDLFKYACKLVLGYHWATGGDGYADYFWYNRSAHAKEFDFITDYRKLQNGDFVIWGNRKRQKNTPFKDSHIAMYWDKNLMVGQNQPYKYVNQKYEPDNVWSRMIGAFRFKAWNKRKNDLEQINYLGTDKSTREIATSFHVYRKKGTNPKMNIQQYKFEGSDITAVQIVLDENTDLCLSYVGYRDWLCSLHNDWMFEHGYEEIMAMNAGYFEMSTGKPVGAVMKDWSGKWADFKGVKCVPSKNNGYPTLTWNGQEMTLLNAYANEIDLSKYAWLCGVGQSLVLNGKVDNSIGTQNGRFNQKNCCTSIGFNYKTRTLTFAINSKVGLNTLQRSYMMSALGCDIAVQLDGGGSAQLEWLQSALNSEEFNGEKLVTTANLNLRSEPNGKIVKLLPKGTEVNWFWETKNDWYKVYIPSMNLQGWCASEYLKQKG